MSPTIRGPQRPGGWAFVVFPSLTHRSNTICRTSRPSRSRVTYFEPRVLVDAYCASLDERGDAATLYSRQPRELHALERRSDGQWPHASHGSDDLLEAGLISPNSRLGGRWEESGDAPLATVCATSLPRSCAPFAHLALAEEAFLHPGAFILRKPSALSTADRAPLYRPPLVWVRPDHAARQCATKPKFSGAGDGAATSIGVGHTAGPRTAACRVTRSCPPFATRPT
jgi:hypothetical protein